MLLASRALGALPLPGGERVGVRGQVTLARALASRALGALPLPGGERVGVRGQVTLDRPLASRALGALPIPGGERVGGRERGTLERPLPPHPTRFARRPLPAGERWSKRRGLASTNEV